MKQNSKYLMTLYNVLRIWTK